MKKIKQIQAVASGDAFTCILLDEDGEIFFAEDYHAFRRGEFTRVKLMVSDD